MTEEEKAQIARNVTRFVQCVECKKLKKCKLTEEDEDENTVIIVHTEKSKYLFGTYPDSESAKEQLTDLAAVWNQVHAFGFR